jgi:hypothetical protein
MPLINVKNADELELELKTNIMRAGRSVIDSLSDYVKSSVIEDYIRRVQQLYYPLKNPHTKQPLDSMQPSEIAKFITKLIVNDRAIVYIPPNTEADKSARMHELYGGRPWQKIRVEMQNIDHVNRIIKALGIGGMKAKAK